MSSILRVNITHTIRSVSLSLISVYIPIYLLTLGFSLSKIINFFILTHFSGVLFTLFVTLPVIKKFGLLNTFKLSIPLQLLFLFLFSLLKTHNYILDIVAISYGISSFIYWTPINIFFIKHSQSTNMGTNLSKFFALPQLFGILGPLIGAFLIPIVGFWPVFFLTGVGLSLSFLPISNLKSDHISLNINFRSVFKRILRNKTVFAFEVLDNIIEESEWFWAIYVYLTIGNLTTPGIVGSLESLGAAIFTLFIGKRANKYGKKMFPIAALIILILFILRIFISSSVSAYIVTLFVSFVFTLYIVSYFSTIFKTVKNDNEEEFMIIREIFVFLGRLVVFITILITISNLKYFFLLPIASIIFMQILYILKHKKLSA